MKQFKLIIILFAFACCKGQNTLKEYKFPQVEWTLKIPANSNFLDSAQFDTLSRKFVNAVKQTFEIDFSVNEVKPLFIIRHGQYNFLGSTINLYDTTLSMTWQESYTLSKKMILQLINEQAPAVKLIDTISSYELIDG